MLNLLKIILLKIIGLLPESPFTVYTNDIDSNFFQYLNWFLPLDTCLNILIGWIDCMLVVLVVFLVKKYLVDVLIDIIKSFANFITFFV